MMRNRVVTRLEAGDQCFFDIISRALVFMREVEALRTHESNDDKFILPHLSEIELVNILDIIAQTNGLVLRRLSHKDHIIIFWFDRVD